MAGFFKDLFAQLAATSVVIAIAGYLLKMWLANRLDRDKSDHEHELEVHLEVLRADWARDLARLNVHETYLHARRVRVIEKLYADVIDAEFALQNFLVSWWAYSNADVVRTRGKAAVEWRQADSVESMDVRGRQYCEKFTEINANLHKNAIWFDDTFIEEIGAAFKPFSDRIVSMDWEEIPAFPKEFENLVEVGQAPRRSVVGAFRAILGVTA